MRYRCQAEKESNNQPTTLFYEGVLVLVVDPRMLFTENDDDFP